MKFNNPEEFQIWMRGQENAAISKAGKLHRVRAGWYLIYVHDRLFEIEQLNYDEPHDLNGWWIARSYHSNYDYSDPMPTLRELKESLGIN